MRKAQILAEYRSRIGCTLQGQRKQARCRQRGGCRLKQWHGVAQIRQQIAGKHQIGLLRPWQQKGDGIRSFKFAIDRLPPCLRQHGVAEIAADQLCAKFCKTGTDEAGTATEIEGGGESRRTRLVAADGLDSFAKTMRPVIIQRAGEMRVEAARILVEQRHDIGRRHIPIRRFPSESRKEQARAQPVVRLDGERPEEGRRGIGQARRKPRLAELKPGRRVGRGAFDRLLEHLDSGRMVAIGDATAAIGKATVGDEIAGGLVGCTHAGSRIWVSGRVESNRGAHERDDGRPAASYVDPMASLKPTDILKITPQGLYCPPGDFHVDPIRPVPRALITHGHADHARIGHAHVLATAQTLAIMAVRYGEDFAGSSQAAALGERLTVGGTTVSFHPAGHVLGSAQIAIEAGGVRIVASGDYKRAPDPTCLPFEVIPCDVFITEATFGLPVFRFGDTGIEVEKLLRSVSLFPDRAHLVGAYSLGKAQRVVALIRAAGYDRPIFMHGAMERLMAFYAEMGIPLGEMRKVSLKDRAKLGGEIVLCPPSALKDLWSRRFPDPVAAFASGWMRTKARARQKGIELPLVISDHADWPGLCATIDQTGAAEIWVTHGQEDALVHWCRATGRIAKPLHMIGYGDEGDTGEGQPEDGTAGAFAETAA